MDLAMKSTFRNSGLNFQTVIPFGEKGKELASLKLSKVFKVTFF